MGQSLHTRWDLLKPNHSDKPNKKERHDQQSRLRTFREGHSVVVKNFAHGAGWLATCGDSEQLAPVTYLVDLSDGKRHADHIKKLCTQTPESEAEVNVDLSLPAAYSTNSRRQLSQTIPVRQQRSLDHLRTPNCLKLNDNRT